MERMLKNKKIYLPLVFMVASGLGYGWWSGKLAELISSGPSPAHHFFMDTSTLPDEVPGTIVTLKKMRNEFIDDVHLALSLEVRKGMSFGDSWNYKASEVFINWIVKRIERGELVSYAVFDNKDNKLIGAVEIRSFWKNDPGQIGAWINEKYWGGGRIQEALKLLTNTYFETMHTTMCEVEIELFNKRSYKAFRKFGFVEKGYHYDLGKKTRWILEYYKK